MEKQQKIVEMAKDICRYQPCCNDVCKPISACDALRYAERAVEAGYCKQSEGEWMYYDILPDDGDGEDWVRYACSLCGERTDAYYQNVRDVYKFCPNCGAKMKGGGTDA